jgi:glycosyltransferase involved in cell wall biosynthesis
MRLSVVIVTKDRPGHLSQCVASLLRSGPMPFEIVVIDGSLSSLDLISTGLHQVKLTQKHMPGIGLPQARNMGARLARGDIVLFLDDDCRIAPDALMHIKKTFQSTSLTGVIGRINNGNPTNVASSVQQAYYDAWFQSVMRGSRHIAGLDLAAFRRRALLSHPFAENLPFGIDEDIELGDRLMRAGLDIVYNVKILARHMGRTSLWKLFIRNSQTGYANEYIKKVHSIDTRRLSHGVSFLKRIIIARAQITKLTLFKKIIFWTAFIIYPFFSGLGRGFFVLMWLTRGSRRKFISSEI